MKEVNAIAVFNIKSEYRDDLLKSFKGMIEETRKEDGVISYALHQDTQDSHIYVMLETWRSKEDLDKHGQTAHFRKLMADIEGKINSFTAQLVEKIY